jgi:hypothetical protein
MDSSNSQTGPWPGEAGATSQASPQDDRNQPDAADLNEHCSPNIDDPSMHSYETPCNLSYGFQPNQITYDNVGYQNAQASGYQTYYGPAAAQDSLLLSSSNTLRARNSSEAFNNTSNSYGVANMQPGFV